MANWTISEKLEAMLVEWLHDFETTQQAVASAIYPSVMWSLGGTAYRASNPGSPHATLSAGYGAGFYNRDPMPKGDGLILVPNDRFGLVVFLPRDEDLGSNRRLIDFDGTSIVVR